MSTVIQTENMTKVYFQGNNKVVANDSISVQICAGEFVAVLGSSGSGKTTFLNLIGGIDNPTSGKIIIKGTDLSSLRGNKFSNFRAKEIGYIFQNYQLIEEISARDNIRIIQDINKWTIDLAYEAEIVDMLGIRDFLDAKPTHLSGGQQQRVAIARALIGNPSIVLADEPTGNLDKKRSKEIIQYMKLSNYKYHQTYIIVTHDVDIAKQCGRIITIEDGKIIEDTRK